MSTLIEISRTNTLNYRVVVYDVMRGGTKVVNEIYECNKVLRVWEIVNNKGKPKVSVGGLSVKYTGMKSFTKNIHKQPMPKSTIGE